MKPLQAHTVVILCYMAVKSYLLHLLGGEKSNI